MSAATIVLMCGCGESGAGSAAAAGSNELLRVEAQHGELDGPQYYEVRIDPADSIFKTVLEFPPETNQWRVYDAAGVLNVAGKYGWQPVWISGDGLRVIIRNEDGTAGILGDSVLK